MPTRQLPSSPSIEHLKYQANDLLRAKHAAEPQAAQRIREFHPRFRDAGDEAILQAPFRLGDAQLAIAREYGYDSWPRIKAYIERPGQPVRTRSYNDRIEDALFRRAVELLDAGDVPALRLLLAENPSLARRRVVFEGGNYFRNPALLEFVAENPERTGKLASNIAEAAQAILDAGAASDSVALDSALMLVASSSVARECGVQRQLVELLCRYGANPNAAKLPPLLYGEFDGVRLLLEFGASDDLTIAAATGRVQDAARMIAAADGRTRQLALSLAAQFGHAELVRLLLDNGADPNRYAPVGGHSHATPLHQAALAGHEDVARLLVARGARRTIKDILHNGTPAAWATHAGHRALAHYLRTPDQR